MSVLPTHLIRHTVLHGDCVEVMQRMTSGSVDFILTDPPYLCRYKSRIGQTIANDDRDGWVGPAFAEMYRLLKPDAFCVSFYGWNAVDKFVAAWRTTGFHLVGHIVFRKRYASATGYTESRHEQAYLLAKGRPELSGSPVPDVMDWEYTGNRLHPTQKPINVLRPLIEAFCPPDGQVLDPFCGSGSTLVAARLAGRCCVGIELETTHCHTAELRLNSQLHAGARKLAG
ncbi:MULTISPECIES: DNA methyltransferase [Bradyrhizobium]|uniref:Methyltransferase n=1 Tax=Bradyrhizobium frederickii TaxID=2560054 RepID=A0A4Y9NSB5_9BRAD|nr:MULTISPECIES: DNA methyltransferase [Bradyrhizobium]RTE88411.1 DNA methylase [Bradyrhizobium sp. LVM 105]TFV30155.1 DNA methylase [Bradyrhizobium frederickii]TFV70232.1 DNA methylase [Bradyrhizobium frederickii]